MQSDDASLILLQEVDWRRSRILKLKNVELEKELDEQEVERMVGEEWMMVLSVLIIIGRLVKVMESGMSAVQYWCRGRSRWRMRRWRRCL